MKKIFIFSICAILLSSCTMTVDQLFSIPAVTVTSEPMREATSTPLDTPSATSTVPTPTFTLTPTLVGLKTPPFTPVIASETPLVLLDPRVDMEGFVTVAVSSSEFYKTAGCEPVSVKFTVQVGDPSNTAFVVLSVRFKSKQTGATGKWAGITMQTIGAGTFTHELFSTEMKSVDSFRNAWVQYQFVATDSKSHEVGRTGVFNESLTLLDCEPTPTPSLIPTPTVLKP